MKCELCSKEIKRNEPCVRLIAEEVSRDELEDGSDPAYWSQVEDWNVVVLMHSSCVKLALREGKRIPYLEEISTLKLSDGYAGSTPQLRVVEGGKL